MNKDLEKTLLERYPKILLSSNERNLVAMFGIDCGDGWYNIIDTLCSSIQNEIDYHNGEGFYSAYESKQPKMEQVVAAQIKEKFGGLRFYTDGSLTDRMRGMIFLAEALSSVTCERCGGPGKNQSKGWVYTMCDPCYKAFVDKKE